MKKMKIPQMYLLVISILSLFLMFGCDGGSSGSWDGATTATTDTTAPTDTTRPFVTVTVPADLDPIATGIATNSSVAVSFNEPMTPLTDVTFTLNQGATSVDGIVTSLANHAVFNPDADLEISTEYTATISSQATDLAGNELAGNQEPLPASSDYVWTFVTGLGQELVAPKVRLTNPDDSAIDVPLNKTINATFSEPMNPLTITTANFTVLDDSLNDVSGTVNYDLATDIATFNPDVNLLTNTTYTAAVSDQALDLAGNALIEPVAEVPTPNPWTFTTGEVVAPSLAIDLGRAASFGIASREGLTSSGVTVVNGDVALDPLASCTDAGAGGGDCLSETYINSTGLTVNGSIYWAGGDGDAIADAVTTDLNLAWIEGFAKENTEAVGFLNGELGGKTIYPGVYSEGSTLLLSVGETATFDAEGDANAVFIFKVGSSFIDYGTLNNPTEIVLANGAQAKNIWFVVQDSATIGSGSIFYGNILAGLSATVNDGSTVWGRVLGGATGAGAITLTGADDSFTTISVP
jgi:hypothetical protein